MKRILVVDDEPKMLDIFRAHFQGRHEVDTATSGALAIERFAHQRPQAAQKGPSAGPSCAARS
jgi:CheY-like chemotaxis protein